MDLRRNTQRAVPSGSKQVRTNDRLDAEGERPLTFTATEEVRKKVASSSKIHDESKRKES